MKGICFKEPLFKPVVAGVKTQTRRIMTPQPDENGVWDDDKFPRSIDSNLHGFNGTTPEGESREFKPRYKVGEVLFLKEPYCFCKDKPMYKYGESGTDLMPGKYWKNKLFMPEKAARYFIEMTKLRAERLQDISDEDCIREGVCEWTLEKLKQAGIKDLTSYENLRLFDDTFSWDAHSSPQKAYAALIDEINGKGTWEANPFVWVYDFKLADRLL